MRAYYNSLCLNCGGRISDERLKELGLCENCIPVIPRRRKNIVKILAEHNKLQNYKKIYELESTYNEFSDFFKKAIGQRMWSLQQVWSIYRQIKLQNHLYHNGQLYLKELQLYF